LQHVTQTHTHTHKTYMYSHMHIVTHPCTQLQSYLENELVAKNKALLDSLKALGTSREGVQGGLQGVDSESPERSLPSAIRFFEADHAELCTALRWGSFRFEKGLAETTYHVCSVPLGTDFTTDTLGQGSYQRYGAHMHNVFTGTAS